MRSQTRKFVCAANRSQDCLALFSIGEGVHRLETLNGGSLQPVGAAAAVETASAEGRA
jgi:hypothetical protein